MIIFGTGDSSPNRSWRRDVYKRVTIPHLGVLIVATKPCSFKIFWNSSTASRVDARNDACPVSLYGNRLMLERVGNGLSNEAKALAKSGLSFTPCIKTTSTNRCSRCLVLSTSAKASLREQRSIVRDWGGVVGERFRYQPYKAWRTIAALP